MMTKAPSDTPDRVRLGPLERRLLQEVWTRKSLTVRELLAEGKIELAYTTVMTTLDRLFKKGLLERTEEGRAFRYSAQCAPSEVAQYMALAEFRRWIAATPSSLPLSCFVEAISEQDANLLDELRILVEQKRLELLKRKEQEQGQ
jgi:predicted transcriptional regulator